MAEHVHDVAVVGFGPVGQACALMLGRAGHDVVVLERWPEPYALPRAVHFDHEIGRIFAAAGVGAQVRKVTDPVPDHYEWRAADGRTLLRIDWSGLGPSGWPMANFFSQPELEAVLAEGAAALPGVRVNRGCEVTGLTEHADHVELRATDRHGADRVVRARYVIGAGDGFADRCLARSAESIWAREGSYLHRWCVDQRVAHTPFTSLEGVARAVAAFTA